MGKKQSPTRAARRAAALAAKQQSERPLQVVPSRVSEEAVRQVEVDEEGLRLDMDLNFLVPPMDLLFADGAALVSRVKRIDLGPAVEAHWNKFAMANPDLKVFSKTVRALLRVLIREYEVAAEKAREEMRSTGLPARPEPGPLLRAVRAERRMIQAEESGELFEEDA